jgi:hypothetical protein
MDAPERNAVHAEKVSYSVSSFTGAKAKKISQLLAP